MSLRSFFVFAAITLFLVVGAILAVISRPVSVEIPKNRPLVFAGLDNKLNSVSEIKVITPSRTFTVNRTESGWGLKELNNFPVLFNKVKTVIVQLSQLRYLEPKTSDPERYSRLHLRSPETKGARSKRVILLSKGGDILAQGVVGKANRALFGEGRSGTYMRFGDKKETWLIEGGLDLGNGPFDWTSKTILDIKRKTVKRLVITSPNGKKVVIQRQKKDQKDFKLEGVPKGKSQRGQWETNDMAKVLDNLKLKDVSLAGDIQFPVKLYLGKIFTFDGLIIKTRAFKKGKRFWININADVISGSSETVKNRARDIASALSQYAFEVDEKPGKKFTCEHVNLIEGAGINACS